MFNGGDTNIYGYVLSDPINLIDPNGKVPLFVAAPLIGAAWGGVVGVIGAASTGGSWADIRSADATGAIGGSAAGLGLTPGLGAAAATAVSLGASMLTALPDSGANPADVGAGLRQLIKPPARSCPQ